MDATSMLMKVRDALNEATSTTWADSVNEARETVTEAVESGEGGVWDELDALFAYTTSSTGMPSCAKLRQRSRRRCDEGRHH